LFSYFRDATLEGIVKTLENTSKKVPNLSEQIAIVKTALHSFKGYVDYTATFIGAVHDRKEVSFDARAQVSRVTRLFKSFAEERGIDVKNEVQQDVSSPTLPVAVYSGILLNLYTNALKAVLAVPSNNGTPIVVFRGWNEPSKHIIEVLDNGAGIPPNLRERIFDPLFTTTSSLNNPLGSGMGLGLSLVRKLMRDLGGAIKLIDPPNGYATCFRLDFPLRHK
jgi:signal transduction histidine kinase